MTIDDIKRSLSIETVLNHHHLTPDQNNRLKCPFHDDKIPSLQIYPKTNTWNCFSSKCDAGSGDQIDFIMKYGGVTKHEALIKATELAGGETKKPDLSRVAILTKYYQGSLHSIQRSKKAQTYATERGLDHNKLNIGYCGFEIGKRWNEDLKKNAEEIGIFKIRNCLIFPMKNKEGQIVSMYGRAITKNPRVRHFRFSFSS